MGVTWKCVDRDAGMPMDADGGDGGDGADEPKFTCNQCEAGANNVCDMDASRCVECLIDDDCRGAVSINKVCDPSNFTCVGCLADSDCKVATKPICNKTILTCESCSTDAQCAAKVPNPGICMFHQDGRCATDEETIYVRYSSGCAMALGSGGTRATPYCLSQLGIDAVSQAQSLVVLQGPDPLTEWAVAAVPQAPITVVGQASATINPGARVGVRVSAGTVHIRALKIASGSNTGVVADSGADLRLDGCVVESNAKGGVQIDGAAFDITNTVIAKNGSTATPGCGGWAGACFNNVLGAPRFLNNTVLANVGTGVACSGSTTTLAGSIIYNNTLEVSLCTVSSCCSGDPMLSVDYRLTLNSPCINRIDMSMATARDIDGQSRPRGQMSDCGADEF
jgi:hypothetical protein